MELPLRGLDGPVELTRDRIGVPHCHAVTEHDAFFAQGVVHAADRLWQMDYDRRRGLGRTAEVLGRPEFRVTCCTGGSTSQQARAAT